MLKRFVEIGRATVLTHARQPSETLCCVNLMGVNLIWYQLFLQPESLRVFFLDFKMGTFWEKMSLLASWMSILVKCYKRKTNVCYPKRFSIALSSEGNNLGVMERVLSMQRRTSIICAEVNINKRYNIAVGKSSAISMIQDTNISCQ